MKAMMPFGVPWEQLKFEYLLTFLEDAPAEPLSWEGKGGDLKAGSVRKQVCGFANGHDVGYLILGTECRDGAWALDGMTFPHADPPNAVTDLIAQGGVTPYPDGLDVRPFDLGGGKHVAVVRIPPTLTPPCMTDGTVFERVSGKTIPVEDPNRPASLSARGDAARQAGKASVCRCCLNRRKRALFEPRGQRWF